MDVVLAGLVVFARGLSALVFAVAAVGKLRDRPAFVASVRELGIGPAGPVAALVIAAELVTVGLLLVPGWPSVVGLVLAAGLLLAFAAGVGAALRRGVRASCRCFGAATAAPYGRRHVARNLALAAVALAGAAAGDREVTGPVLVAALPLAAVAALVVTRLDDLADLFAAPARG